VEWPSHYRRVGWVDYSLTALGTTTAIVSRAVGPGESGPSGGMWFDEGIRDALRASSEQGREVTARVSDGLWAVVVFHGLVGDPWIHLAGVRKSADVAYQMFWMNAEVMAITQGIQQTASNIVGRDRPYGRNCPADPSADDHHCSGRERYRSFISSHTSVPFSLAVATCMHHSHLPLSGKAAWAVCAAGLGVSAATGTMRIVSDNHYATDVFIGAALGTLVGISVPWFHYSTGVRPTQARVGGVEMTVLPFVRGARGTFAPGLGVMGML
jgi:membrane-associated phospholipid phosphatase